MSRKVRVFTHIVLYCVVMQCDVTFCKVFMLAKLKSMIKCIAQLMLVSVIIPIHILSMIIVYMQSLLCLSEIAILILSIKLFGLNEITKFMSEIVIKNMVCISSKLKESAEVMCKPFKVDLT
jgi:hypothetical protein